jgi:ribokinase
MAAGRVLVIGSANVDVSVTTAVLPRPGETVAGDAAMIAVGGKGANQAVAAAACGAQTEFIGCIGDDAFARLVREELTARGVGVGRLRAVAGATTGIASICVDQGGQNCIVVVSGANSALAAADLAPFGSMFAESGIVVMQCETPLATVHRGIELAAAAGTPVILNPAPSGGVDLGELPDGVTYLVPNEAEAAQLSGMPVGTVREAQVCAARLHASGFPCVIITLGDRGCVVQDSDGSRHIPAAAVKAIDTTGAGDAFIGCLAAALAAGRPRDEAVRRASLYASLSTTRRGAQVSYAEGPEFERIWLGSASPH